MFSSPWCDHLRVSLVTTRHLGLNVLHSKTRRPEGHYHQNSWNIYNPVLLFVCNLGRRTGLQTSDLSWRRWSIRVTTVIVVTHFAMVHCQCIAMLLGGKPPKLQASMSDPILLYCWIAKDTRYGSASCTSTE